MKAAVFHAPGKIICDTMDNPIIQDQNDTQNAMYGGVVPK